MIYTQVSILILPFILFANFHAQNAHQHFDEDNTGFETSSSACSNGNGNLTFSACSDGLPWPIEDFSSITVLLTHGVHCIQIIQRADEPGEFHAFHREHCMELVREIQRFFQMHPGFVVPDGTCRDLRELAFPGGRVRRGTWSGWNGRKKRAAFRRRDVPSQDIHFKALATRNFELLLLKAKSGSTLSQSERDYLAESRSPLTIRISAIGIFCKYEEYAKVLKDVLGG